MDRPYGPRPAVARCDGGRRAAGQLGRPLRAGGLRPYLRLSRGTGQWGTWLLLIPVSGRSRWRLAADPRGPQLRTVAGGQLRHRRLPDARRGLHLERPDDRDVTSTRPRHASRFAARCLRARSQPRQALAWAVIPVAARGPASCSPTTPPRSPRRGFARPRRDLSLCQALPPGGRRSSGPCLQLGCAAALGAHSGSLSAAPVFCTSPGSPGRCSTTRSTPIRTARTTP